MNLGSALGLLAALVSVPLCWYVYWRLRRLANADPDVVVLDERGDVALGLAVIVTVFALIFLNNDLPHPILDNATTRIITRGTLFGVPTFVCLRWIYRVGRGKNGANGVNGHA